LAASNTEKKEIVALLEWQSGRQEGRKKGKKKVL
jgi:hypothetical protein